MFLFVLFAFKSVCFTQVALLIYSFFNAAFIIHLWRFGTIEIVYSAMQYSLFGPFIQLNMSYMPSLGDCHVSQFTYAFDVSSIVC